MNVPRVCQRGGATRPVNSPSFPPRSDPPAKPRVWKPNNSDVTAFIDQLKAAKPTLEDEQRRGRSLLWDRPIDRTAEAEYGEAKVPQQPYVYQTRQR